MSDTYKIGTVTVVSLGGGWYELKHDSLSEPKKVHGKEAADRAAAELDATPEGRMEPQSDMVTTGSIEGNFQATDPRSPAEKVQERDAGLPDPTPPAPPAQAPVEDTKQADENARLKEEVAAQKARADEAAGQLAEFRRKFEAFLASAQPLAAKVGEEDPVLGQVPATAPREYRGQMTKEAKALFKKAGIEVKTIVLEENESIPPTGLFVGHNGRSYMIVPGEEVDVPDFLLNVLNDAVMSSPQVDSKSQKVLGYRNRSKYPYRIVS